MVSNNLLGALAAPTNHVAQAFDTRTQQLDQTREVERQKGLDAQRQQDADFHKVVQYAGDGLVDEAKYFAQQKGIQVPDAVFSNAEFAKGLSMAGSIYGDDPERAQVFTDAFMKSQGDLNARFQAGIQLAGKPVSQSDRDFQNFVRKEQWKLKNSPSAGGAGFTLSPGASRYDGAGNVIATAPGKAVGGAEDETDKYASKIWQDTYLAAIEGDGMTQTSRKSPQEAEAIANEAASGYRRAFGAPQGGAPAAPTAAAPSPPQMPRLSSGLTDTALPSNPMPLMSEDELNSMVERAEAQGYSREELIQHLEDRGMI